jgi:hypothetical protein
MTKQLEIGKDYASTMQVKPGTEAIYNGGISWTMRGCGREQTADSQKMTDATVAYINRSNVSMGSPR